MAQTNFTPLQLYHSVTPAAVPSAANLLPGELALNIADTDMALYAENASGTVTLLINNPAGLKYPTADGTVNQVVATNGSGVLSFVSAATGDVTLTGTQTLTNKTISADDNTLSGIAASSFVLSNASGNIDGTVAQKVIPAGAVVGTTDTQTLTNKTIRQMTTVISTNTNATASNIYVMSASLTLTLPALPTAGDWISFTNRSETTTPVVARNGSNIMGLAEDMTLDSVNASGTLVYADATRGWVLID
jgi:hypothetical protein